MIFESATIVVTMAVLRFATSVQAASSTTSSIGRGNEAAATGTALQSQVVTTIEFSTIPAAAIPTNVPVGNSTGLPPSLSLGPSAAPALSSSLTANNSSIPLVPSKAASTTITQSNINTASSPAGVPSKIQESAAILAPASPRVGSINTAVPTGMFATTLVLSGLSTITANQPATITGGVTSGAVGSIQTASSSVLPQTQSIGQPNALSSSPTPSEAVATSALVSSQIQQSSQTPAEAVATSALVSSQIQQSSPTPGEAVATSALVSSQIQQSSPTPAEAVATSALVSSQIQQSTPTPAEAVATSALVSSQILEPSSAVASTFLISTAIPSATRQSLTPVVAAIGELQGSATTTPVGTISSSTKVNIGEEVGVALAGAVVLAIIISLFYLYNAHTKRQAMRLEEAAALAAIEKAAPPPSQQTTARNSWNDRGGMMRSESQMNQGRGPGDMNMNTNMEAGQYGGGDGQMGNNQQPFNDPGQSINIYASPSALYPPQNQNDIPSQLKPGFTYSQPEEMIRGDYPNNALQRPMPPDNHDNGRMVPEVEPWRRDGEGQVAYGQPAEGQYPNQYMPEERFPYGNGPDKDQHQGLQQGQQQGQQLGQGQRYV